MNRKTLEDYFAQENPRYEEAARFPTENKRDFTEIPTFLDVKPTPLEHVDDAFLLKDDPNQEAGLSTLSQEDIKNAEAQLNASSASSGSSGASAASASSGGGLASLVSGGATVATIGVVGAVVAEVVAAAFAVLVPKLLNIDYFATDSSVSYRCVFEEYQETAEYAVRVYNEAIQGQDFQKPLQFVQSNVADVYFDGLMPSTAYTLNVMGREKDSSTEWTVFNDYTVSFTTDAPPRVLISPTIENIEMAPRVDGFYWYGHFTSYEQDVEYGLHIHNENEERYYPFVLRDGPYVNEEFLGLTPDTEYQLDIVGREQGTLEWTAFPTYALTGKTHYLPDAEIESVSLSVTGDLTETGGITVGGSFKIDELRADYGLAFNLYEKEYYGTDDQYSHAIYQPYDFAAKDTTLIMADDLRNGIGQIPAFDIGDKAYVMEMVLHAWNADSGYWNQLKVLDTYDVDPADYADVTIRRNAPKFADLRGQFVIEDLDNEKVRLEVYADLENFADDYHLKVKLDTASAAHESDVLSYNGESSLTHTFAISDLPMYDPATSIWLICTYDSPTGGESVIYSRDISADVDQSVYTEKFHLSNLIFRSKPDGTNVTFMTGGLIDRDVMGSLTDGDMFNVDFNRIDDDGTSNWVGGASGMIYDGTCSFSTYLTDINLGETLQYEVYTDDGSTRTSYLQGMVTMNCCIPKDASSIATSTFDVTSADYTNVDPLYQIGLNTFGSYPTGLGVEVVAKGEDGTVYHPEYISFNGELACTYILVSPIPQTYTLSAIYYVPYFDAVRGVSAVKVVGEVPLSIDINYGSELHFFDEAVGTEYLYSAITDTIPTGTGYIHAAVFGVPQGLTLFAKVYDAATNTLVLEIDDFLVGSDNQFDLDLPAGDYEVRIVNENGTVFQTISLEILPAYTFFLPTFIIGETIDYGDGTIRLPYATETNEAYIGTYFGYKIVAEGSDGSRYESDMLTATGSDMGITLDAPNYNGEGAEIELYYIKDGENRFITSYTKEG